MDYSSPFLIATNIYTESTQSTEPQVQGRCDMSLLSSSNTQKMICGSTLVNY